MEKSIRILKTRLGKENYRKLKLIKNPELHQFDGKHIDLCNPDEVFVCTDLPEDIECIREEAIRSGEERELAISSHTVHFDGYYDQARDKENTKFLLPKGVNLGPNINSMDREKGLKRFTGC